jgi:hypothetical protein
MAFNASIIMKSCLMLILAVGSLQVSCTQGPVYPEPQPTRGQTATIHESSRKVSFLNMSFFGLSKVDGLPLRVKTRLSKGGLSRTLPAGKHELTLLMAHSSPEFQHGQLRAEGNASVMLEADRHYEVHGELVDGTRADLWLQEKDTQRKVSGVIRVVPQRQHQPMPIYVPIPAG